MTLEEKEKIDYEIEAKKKARDKELSEWNQAFLLIIIIIVMIMFITSQCS